MLHETVGPSLTNAEADEDSLDCAAAPALVILPLA